MADEVCEIVGDELAVKSLTQYGETEQREDDEEKRPGHQRQRACARLLRALRHIRPVYWAAALAAGPLACAPPLDSASKGLVLVRIVEGSREIVRIRLADAAARAVTSTPEREESWPYWSNAAGRVAYEVAQPGDDAPGDLVLWNPETASEHPLTSTPRRDERWATWSPDGSGLAYAFRGPGSPAAGVAIADIARGSHGVAAAAPPASFYVRPQFAPKGGVLVAQRRGLQDGTSRLWLLGGGRPPQAVSSGPGWFEIKAYFTRDGSQIVFSRRPSAGGPYEVAIRAVGVGDARPLLEGRGGDEHSGRPSPTRDELVFVSNRAGSYDAFLVGLSGSNLRALTHTPDRDEFAPRWSPDGERVALTVSPAGGGLPRLTNRESLTRLRVVVLDRDGETLLDVPGFMPDWMPPWP